MPKNLDFVTETVKLNVPMDCVHSGDDENAVYVEVPCLPWFPKDLGPLLDNLSPFEADLVLGAIGNVMRKIAILRLVC